MSKSEPQKSIGELRSVLVLRCVILVACLDAVVTVAERLPVAFVPEENLVSAVWSDVIHIGRLDVASSLQALNTQRMDFEVTLACLVPSAAVASLRCRSDVLRMQRLVFITVLRAIGNE